MYVWDYINVPRDLDLLRGFKEDVDGFFVLRLSYLQAPTGNRRAGEHELVQVRERIARSLAGVREILARHRLRDTHAVRDPLVMGGAWQDFSLLSAILHPQSVPGDVINETVILDFIDYCLGEFELRHKERWRKLWNPFKWLWDGLEYSVERVPALWQLLRQALKRGSAGN